MEGHGATTDAAERAMDEIEQLLAKCYSDTSWGLINPVLLARVRVSDVEIPKTPK